MAHASRTRQGFTLLEVMIAVVILAVGLSALFTSEAGAIRIAHRARTTTVATLLARCKMAEIEEKLAKEGWTTNAIDDRDACCDGAEHDGFSCEWKVDRIVLPDFDQTPEDATKKAADKLKGSAAGDPGKAGGTPAGGSPAGGTPAGPSDPTSLGGAMGIPLGSGTIGGGGMTGSEGGGGGMMGGGGGMDMVSSMLMELTFPIMKPIIEENVRRVTVTVKWKEGASEQSFDVVQFIVNEALGLMPSIDEENEVGTPPPGSPPTAAPPPATPGPAPGTSGN